MYSDFDADFCLFAVCAAAALFCANIRSAAAGDALPVPYAAEVCTGYDPATKSWGMIGAKVRTDVEGACPPGQAYLSTRQISGELRSGIRIPLVGTCCPLPPGVLTDEHTFEPEHCPEGFVATGFKQQFTTSETDRWGKDRVHYMRCTRVDSTRFALMPATTGYNVGWFRHFSTMYSNRTTRARIPGSLRYGLGRTGPRSWRSTICVGRPWGALLVGKTSKYCTGMYFSELRYRDPGSGAPSGVPAIDYSKCLYVKNPLSEKPECGS